VIGGLPQPADQAVAYAVVVADALAHAHDRKVVHGDLKAGNILISSDRRLKIVDFGLAYRADTTVSDVTTRTSHAGLAVGTPYAMAPEQIRGARPDERTDLWALGILLCELVAGAPPFRGNTAAETFAAILRDSPASLPARTPQAVRTIVSRCLTKDSSARYQRAADVRLALETVVASFRREETTRSEFDDGRNRADGHQSLAPALTRAESIEFVGRERQLERMREAWTAAVSGQRQILLVAGEPGIGKTQLALTFARERTGSNVTVLIGRCEEEALTPYQPLVEALTWYVRSCPQSDLRAHVAAISGAEELVTILPELMHRLPALPSRGAMSPEGQRYRLFQAVAGILRSLAAARPVLLIVEDLHWADKSTLLLLRHLMRVLVATRLCIIGTYRESERGRLHPLGEFLAALRTEADVTRVMLDGLEEADVRGLITHVSGPAAATALTSAISGSTGGNPFFVTQVLRHLHETGALSRFSAGTVIHDIATLGVPEGVKEVLGHRISRLSEGCSRLLTLASVLGRSFDGALLAALRDLPEHALYDAIDEATAVKLIAQAPDSPSRFQFIHALVRETIYDAIAPSRRAHLHRRGGETLEELMAAGGQASLADLAHHFGQAAGAGQAVPGGPVDKAIDYATRAGDRAADMLAHEEAARFYQLALRSVELKAAGPDVERRRVDLYTRQSHVFGSIGQWALQKHALESALQHLPADHAERRAELMAELCNASHFLLDTATTERLASDALTLAETVHRSDLAADALGILATCRQAAGDLPGAIETIAAAVARAGGIKRRAHALGPMSLYLAGRAGDAVSLAAEAAASARASHDAAFVMYALPHEGLILATLGRFREAQDVFEEVRRFGRKYGALPMLARAIAISAGYHLSAFDYAGARELQEEARDLARSAGFAPPVVSAGIDLLLAATRSGNSTAAERLLREVETAVETTPGWHEWLWRLRLSEARAEFCLARGDFEDAVSCASESIALSRTRCRPKYEALGLVTRARALQALGQTTEASVNASAAVGVADSTGDVALTFLALAIRFSMDREEGTAQRARAIGDQIELALPDDTMRRRFRESEIVQQVRACVHRLSNSSAIGKLPTRAMRLPGTTLMAVLYRRAVSL